MSNLFDPRAENFATESFDPNVDNSRKLPKSGIASKIVWYSSFILVLPIYFHFSWRNSFLATQNKINETASGIDVQLKKRKDLLGKLLDATKGYVNYEKSVLENVTKLRQLNINASNRVQAEENINSAFARLLAVAENYPNLKANESFNKLMDSSAYLEQEIAASRRLYNSEVNRFNTNIFLWPKVVISSSMGLSTMPLFQASNQDKEDVKFEF